jgi:hypothetical protein
MDNFQDNQARNNFSRTTEEPYSRDRMDTLKQIVTRVKKNGKTRRFSISIDGEIVVPRTFNPEEFDDYLEYLDHYSKVIEVRTYFGLSFNCNVHRLYLKEMPKQHSSNLNGVQLGAVEVNEKIEQALAKQRLETDIMLLQKDNAELVKQNESFKKKLKGFKKLQAKLDEKQIDISEIFTKGIELFGAFRGGKAGQVAGASAQVQGLPPSEAPIVVEAQEPTQADLHFEALKKRFSEKELLKAMQSSELLVSRPDLREEFQTIVKSKIKKDE